MNLRVRSVTADSVLRHAMPLALLLICFQTFPQLLVSVSISEVFDLIGALPVWTWLTAITFTTASFYFVGQYDVLAKRHLHLPGAENRWRQNGMISVALSQLLGFGLITGSLARYRLNPGQGVLRAGQVTAFVTVFFLIGMVFVTALAVLISGMVVGRAVGLAVLTGLVGVVLCLGVLRPRIRLWTKEITIPALPAMVASVVWAAADVLMAAIAFYVLLPVGVELGFFTFLPVFCIALAAGIVSGVPGGVGPFEVVLLGLTAPHLPTHIDQTSLLTAICGFRAVYYVLPALIAAVFVLRSPAAAPEAPAVSPTVSLSKAPRAEAGVIAQNGGHMVALPSGGGAFWPAGNSLVSLFDPYAAPGPEWVQDFKHHARSRNLIPFMYKCSARYAVAARRVGWNVVHVANDAMLAPMSFDLDGAKRAGLRRKLRKAAKAGVVVGPFRHGQFDDLAQVDRAWQARSGGARGGTMGRFCGRYLATQRVLVAQVDGRPVAFITLHTGQTEWALDLMRDTPDAPDGTMYLLVHEAIKLAAQARIPKMSLAAVPAKAKAVEGTWSKPLNYMRGKWAAKGLHQFKASFAPEWMPLYMAAPCKVELCIGAMDVLREVLRPKAVQSSPPDPMPQEKAGSGQTA